MKILLIEDENEIALNIQNYLNENEFVCEWEAEIDRAMERLELYEYDVVLLDLRLSNRNGFEVLDFLKNKKRREGIIIISAKDNIETRIEGLTLGADDYIIKPFHLPELLVRIQALIRRKQFNGINEVIFNELTIDLMAKSVHVNNMPVDLTKMEFQLLVYLIGNKNRVLSKSAISETLSGDMADMLDNYDFIYAHIKNLKKKLKESGCGEYIKTVYGLGYKWQDV
ncbi:MAG: DNA-binding response regulator [Ignavibacteriae bacterium HGW-Ignavibacteriae-4]|jgi:DNA-binding response OmpR family regulator|nr:MAG: DNA-binding response regulator [Ignavibacteriae bacterium HGW-Ignavibacteriae-4]